MTEPEPYRAVDVYAGKVATILVCTRCPQFGGPPPIPALEAPASLADLIEAADDHHQTHHEIRT